MLREEEIDRKAARFWDLAYGKFLKNQPVTRIFSKDEEPKNDKRPLRGRKR